MNLGTNPIRYSSNHMCFFTHVTFLSRNSSIKKMDATKYKTPEKEMKTASIEICSK